METQLTQGAQGRGYTTELWTTSRVADLIEQECGVKYHPGMCGCSVQGLGWSCQRPAKRALERDEEKIERWKKRRWPKLKKKPEGKTHDSVYRRERIERKAALLSTWSPKGQTPILQYHFNWKHLSAMAGVTWRKFYFRLFFRFDSQPAGGGVFETPVAPYQRESLGDMGRP